MITIRSERSEDAAQIRVVNELAFGQQAEAALVEKLRRTCPDSVSLVAVDETLVGHILFTPAVIETTARRVVGMGLGPMAVVPDRQRQGIGSQLVTRGVEILRQRDCFFVVVIGHPHYYPRFGFVSARARGLTNEWPGVPEAAFMVLILDPHRMAGVSGIVRYREEFMEIP